MATRKKQQRQDIPTPDKHGVILGVLPGNPCPKCGTNFWWTRVTKSDAFGLSFFWRCCHCEPRPGAPERPKSFDWERHAHSPLLQYLVRGPCPGCGKEEPSLRPIEWRYCEMCRLYGRDLPHLSGVRQSLPAAR